MEPDFPLRLDLPPPGSRRRLQALHAQLRAAIVEGRLVGGLRLPTTRALAEAHGISRNTAVEAYRLLLSEGYVVARAKAGTFVAETLPKAAPRRKAPNLQRRQHLNPYWRDRSAVALPATLRCDFRLGVPDTRSFPFPVWRRLAARALRQMGRQPAEIAEAEGRPALRSAIARHISFSRAVACRADDIIVMSGAQQAFDLLARTLVTPGKTVVAIENPGYPPMVAAFAAAGARIVRVPVDREGLVTARIPADTAVICVTPSHQFPLGVAMSASRRAALLEFARRRDAVVVEDDYDGEFRFGGRVLDALQTLDRDERVFYVGTFSKSLFPALRIGFVVTPPWALGALSAAKRVLDWHCPTAGQETLAAFIGEGHLARHVRRMQATYAHRRDLLLHALQNDFRHWLEPLPSEAGLHLSAAAIAPIDPARIAERARTLGIGIYPLHGFQLGSAVRRGFAFGYGAIEATAIAEALRRLRPLFEKGAR
jgi:GntR family transcriptional regulator/MocR family aminotransferase